MEGIAAGIRGTLILGIPGRGEPGEVELPCNGGTTTAIAYANEPIQKGSEVVVLQVRANRRVDVAEMP